MMVLRIGRPLWCGVVLYGVWGDGWEGVYVAILGECDLLWGLVIVVNYEDGGYHSGPMDGFHGRGVIYKVY